MAEARLGYLGLGGNLPPRLATLRHAAALLASAPGLRLLRSSSVYESPAVGFESEHLFLNAVLEMEWSGTARQLLSACLEVERACGRVRSAPETQSQQPDAEPAAAESAATEPAAAEPAARYADRTLDIDILWLDGAECDLPGLRLPHPRAHQRAFVLLPWCELAPEMVLHGRRLEQWLAELDTAARSAVQLYTLAARLLPE